jgi:hypothetical protein
MSNAAEEVDDRAGASCGVGEVDGVKSEECSEHDEEFDSADELHDRKLFTQPDETHEGECPLCCLPLPIDPTKSLFYTCCSQTICRGCVYANQKSSNGDHICPFCRESAVGEEENRIRMMKRVKANDPVALREMGTTSLSRR